MPEPKYVERGSLLQKAKLLQGDLFAVPLILDAIEYAPAVDVVEVVRCKDCKYFLNDTDYCKEHNKGYCEWDDTIKSKSHFCSYGERKEGAEE